MKTNIQQVNINQLLAYAEMRGVEPDVATAEGLLGSVRSSRPQHLTPKNVIDKTAKYFRLKLMKFVVQNEINILSYLDRLPCIFYEASSI